MKKLKTAFWPIPGSNIDNGVQCEEFAHEHTVSFGSFGVDFAELERFNPLLDKFIESSLINYCESEAWIDELQYQANTCDKLMKEQ